jgi:adenylosuccinate synthase
MSKVITIFGGQFGSEGKGEVAALFTRYTQGVVAGVRIGGPNAGHTSYDEAGNKVVVQTLPTPSALAGVDAFIGPEGCFIPSLLVLEIGKFYQRNPSGQLTVYLDPNAGVITDEHMSRESELKGKIGSTGEGVGAVTADKVMRKPITVKDHPDLVKWLISEVKQLYSGISNLVVECVNVPEMINRCLANNAYSCPNKGRFYTNPTFIIEGTQGYGLSLHTGGFYPFCTSRECTPYALWAGTGINPKLGESDTIMVVRTYPIRVGGNSGPLANEITWDVLEKMTDGYVKVPEMTTVTKKVRRIAEIDFALLSRAVLQTTPDYIALTFLDYKFPKVAGMTWDEIIDGKHWDAVEYVEQMERKLRTTVGIISTGPDTASFTPMYKEYYVGHHAGINPINRK